MASFDMSIEEWNHSNITPLLRLWVKQERAWNVQTDGGDGREESGAQRCTKSRLGGVYAESYMCQLAGVHYTNGLRYVVLLEFARKNISDPDSN